MDEFLADIRRELNPDESSEVYATLSKIFANILRNPEQAKFRTLKKDNRLVAERLCRSMGAISVLFMVGFEETDDTYTCPMTTDLGQMAKARETIEHMTMSLDVLDQPASSSTAPAAPVAASRVAPVTRSLQRTSEEDRQRSQQQQDLQALREARKEQHRENAKRPASTTATMHPQPTLPSQPTPDLLSGDVDTASEVADCFDLLSGGHQEQQSVRPNPQPTLGAQQDDLLVGFGPQDQQSVRPNPQPTLGAQQDDLLVGFGPQEPIVNHDSGAQRKPVSKPTVYNFQRRGCTSQQQATNSLQDIRKLQKEKFKQHQQDPRAAESAAYAQPPSGVFVQNGNGNGHDGATRPTASPHSSWLADTSRQLSDGLKGTSERISSGFSDASEKLSKSLVNFAGCTAMPVMEPDGPDLDPGTLPGRFRVISHGGVAVRSDVDGDSPILKVLERGTECVGTDRGMGLDGQPRLHIQEPVAGWLTLKRSMLERVSERPDEFG